MFVQVPVSLGPILSFDVRLLMSSQVVQHNAIQNLLPRAIFPKLYLNRGPRLAYGLIQ